MRAISILIVDDRPENLLALEQVLETPTLNVVRANSGHEALERTLDHEFALILLDVQMPIMDGYETAALLRGNKRTKHIPIIFVTAASKEQSQVFLGYGSGAVDYLFKPLEPDVLKSKVTIFLELYRQRRLLEEKTRELDAKILELETLKLALEDSNEKLRQLSSLDGLTDLPNRRFFDETIAREWQRGIRRQKPLSLILADIDHFKAFNDAYGHVVGDDCLKRVAKGLEKSILRDMDTIARYGGEEFAAILPETDNAGAVKIIQRMLKSIEALKIDHIASPTADHVTVSFGLSTMLPISDLGPTQLIQSADKALYLAKNSGRNTYTIN
ncbi:MAG: diguanylate cyclase [Proteobacteria bacterium]|nr:diguanylate cyclase [Pseudomonadota bacterium]